MSIHKEIFGYVNNQTIYKYIVKQKDLELHVLSYGGIIQSLIYKGVDVVLGRDTMEEYLNNKGYFGALIGRNCNRLENAEIVVHNKIYKLNANEGNNNLHGGYVGFDKKIWEVEETGENVVTLSTISPDGEEGFPGEARVWVTYTITDDSALRIYFAACVCDTLL